MKGLLLCGGNDSGLASMKLTLPRQMLPISNIPLAEYAVKSMVNAGIRSIGIVVGEDRVAFSSHFKEGRSFNCRIRYIEQPKPIGTANAILCARDFLNDEDFVLVYGDIYFEGSLSEYIQLFKKERLDALILGKKVENPWQYGVISVTGKKVTRMVEKPAVTVSDLAAIGVYIFRHPILKASSRIKPSHEDGSYGISDAIQYLIDREYRLSYAEITEDWCHVDNSKSLIECNKLVNLKAEYKNCITEDSQITGTVLGEGISIGSRCFIKDSTIKDSVIMEDCIINGVELCDSLVCRGCHITGCGRISGMFTENTRIAINLP